MRIYEKANKLISIPTIIFGILIWLFWWLVLPFHLHYQEQLQLFLLTKEYFVNELSYPGGIGEYISEFFTQFYYYPILGAFIVASLLMIIQSQVWYISIKNGAKFHAHPLSFIPSLLLFCFMLDESSMLSFVVSIAIILGFCAIYENIKKDIFDKLFISISILILYWICGGASFIFIAWVAYREFVKKYLKDKKTSDLICIVIYLAMSIAIPIITSNIIQYPLFRLFFGIGYYRFPTIYPYVIPIIILSILLIPALSHYIHFTKKGNLKTVLGYIIIAFCGIYFISKNIDFSKEEVMKYDYYTKEQQWDKIIECANKNNPTSPITVTSLNLALGKTGELGDRMFQFFQNGKEGLIPDFKNDFTFPLVANEVYYHLGMINTSQRFTFEAMEAIPNYKKSSRCFKRLAQTNLINGQYKVAEKYLRALQHTLFYSKWADETMQYVKDKNKIKDNKEYKWLIEARYTDDFLFSNMEMDDMLGLLFQHNRNNKLAFEYLLAYTLENKDIEKFMRYYPLGKDLGYDHIPRSYQEVLVYLWTQSHPNFNGLPWSIDSSVMNGISQFAKIYMSGYNAKEILQERYQNTFWYYLLYR